MYVLLYYAESNLPMLKLLEESEWALKIKFAALAKHACTKLESKVSEEDFRTCMIHLFKAAHYILPSFNVRNTFDAIGKNEGWNFRSYKSLKKVLELYGVEDDETKEKLSRYEEALTSYNVTTGVKDWIEKHNLDKKHAKQPQPLPDYDYTEISTKLGWPVAEKTLQDIRILWEEVAKTVFKMPNLDAVLYDIQEGCTYVTWLVPRIVEWTTTNILNQTDFFGAQNILLLMLNHECIYPEQVC